MLRKYAEGVMDALAQPGLTLCPLLMASRARFDGAVYLAGLRPLSTSLSTALDKVYKKAA